MNQHFYVTNGPEAMQFNTVSFSGVPMGSPRELGQDEYRTFVTSDLTDVILSQRDLTKPVYSYYSPFSYVLQFLLAGHEIARGVWVDQKLQIVPVKGLVKITGSASRKITSLPVEDLSAMDWYVVKPSEEQTVESDPEPTESTDGAEAVVEEVVETVEA